MAQRLHPAEFVALMAMMMATVAFSIDSMLPAPPSSVGIRTTFGTG